MEREAGWRKRGVRGRQMEKDQGPERGAGQVDESVHGETTKGREGRDMGSRAIDRE